jgi:hypothetical protein
MAINREAIFAKLFARLETIVDPTLAGGKLLRFATRVYQGWDEVAPSQCPAALLLKGDETRPRRIQGLPPIVSLMASIVLYAKNDEERQVPASTQLNELITAIEALLERQPGELPSTGAVFPNNPDGSYGTTLGGLCFSCQIAGTVQTFEGVLDQDSAVIIPIEILTTA